MRNKGFTLVELIIVITILTIIMLIGTVGYSSIQNKMQIKADMKTAAQIGKALLIREADVENINKIKEYPVVTTYDDLVEIERYISKDIKPQSMKEGEFIVTALRTPSGRKIMVGIGKIGEEIKNTVYKNKNNTGWAWSEGTEINDFLEKNKELLSEGLVIPEDGNISEEPEGSEGENSGGGPLDGSGEEGGTEPPEEETETVGEYTLTVNPNGGTWSDGTRDSKVFSDVAGSTAIIPEITPKIGTITLTFDGNGGKINGNDTITKSKNITQARLALDNSAYGTYNSSTRTYTFGEGNDSMRATNYAYFSASDCEYIPVKEGFAFAGWNTKADGTGYDRNTSSYPYAGSITWYAMWQDSAIGESEYTLTVYADGGTWSDGTYANKIYKGNAGDTVIIPDITKTVYFNFYGNNGTIDGKNLYTAEQVCMTSNFSKKSGKGTYNSSTRTFTFGEGDATLSKEWVVNTESACPYTPIREGYTFLGWEESAESTTVYSKYINTKDKGILNLYAIWE